MVKDTQSTREPSQNRPLIIQSDRTLLLDVHGESFEIVRNALLPFTELIKSPEHMHTYAISPISLWNAASSGLSTTDILGTLDQWSRFPVPESVRFYINDQLSRYGKILMIPCDPEVCVDIEQHADFLLLSVPDESIRLQIFSRKELSGLIIRTPIHADGFYIRLYDRGEVKLRLIRLGFPVDDRVPLVEGSPLDVSLRETSLSGYPFRVRDYQHDATSSLLGDGAPGTGFGTLVLPCGSGKTIIGIDILKRLATHTLIVTTNIAAVHQWIHELKDKTTLQDADIKEYTGEKKEIGPVTVCTYQILTWKKKEQDEYPHFTLFRDHDWGLIIYDEVHMLPAPVFKVTAELQAIHRVGLTATLIREDGREDEVFSLVGPRRYNVPWKVLEQKGWIAEAHCYEIRIGLPEHLELPYAIGTKREKFRIASENPIKTSVVSQLIENHPEDHILIIGQYIDQLQGLSKELRYPLITGSTPNTKREELYDKFRRGSIRVLIVSKVANFAIDLPDASVAIQVSGTFGSRQEEAQRLGRILRPKEHGSTFYSLVTRYTTEEEFAANRQKFLAEQGYKYHIEVWD